MITEVNEGIRHQTLKEKIYASIPVEKFINTYNISNPDVVETIYEFPVLSYLLGSVTDRPQGMDARPDGVTRPYWLVTEGSSMFGLKNPEDVMRWKGIFNHVIGAARHVYFLADKIANATPMQKQKLLALGYTPTSLASLSPDLLRDHKLIDHAGRRQTDELEWHPVHDKAHPSTNSVQNTLALLERNGADSYFLHHMKEEDHSYLFTQGKNGRLKDIQFAILTYGDWTYEQKPMDLVERFGGLRSRGRADEKTLDVLETLGQTFESDLKQVFGDSIVLEMMELKPFEWEEKIKKAYASSAGLTVSEIFKNRS